jgi:hypothetical protein
MGRTNVHKTACSPFAASGDMKVSYTGYQPISAYLSRFDFDDRPLYSTSTRPATKYAFRSASHSTAPGRGDLQPQGSEVLRPPVDQVPLTMMEWLSWMVQVT